MMNPIPEFVMFITLWRKKAVEQMSAIAGDAPEQSVIRFSTGAVECQGGDCAVSELTERRKNASRRALSVALA